MTDAEPSNAELARRLDGITALLQQVVGRPEYSADQRLTEHRFTEIEHDVADLRRTHDDDIKEVHRRLDEDHKQRGADWRQGIYSGILPFAVGIALVLITAWVSKGGK